MKTINKILLLLICAFSFNFLQATKPSIKKDGFITCLGSGVSHAIVENPLTIAFGGYMALTDFDSIKRNSFWTAFFGAAILSSVLRHTFSVKLKNSLVKTCVESPFFTLLAAHTLICNRENIQEYPLLTMFVGGTLVYNLAQNCIDRESEVVSDDDSSDKGSEDDMEDDCTVNQ